MNDDHLADPGPVGEYRDPELARRFEADPVPGPGPDFWLDLEAALDHRAAGNRRAREVVDRLDRRWGPGRWLAVAAVTLAVVGLGSLAVVLQGQRSSPIESAAPTSSTAFSDTTTSLPDEDAESTTTTAPTTSRPETESSPSTTGDPVTGGDLVVDYFGGDASVAPIGTGRVVGFSPDDSVALVVADAVGSGTGCEGAPLLALYAQDLATGDRTLSLGSGSTIETGGLDLAISPFGPTAAEVETRPVYWTEWCDGDRLSTWRGLLAPDGTISLVEAVDEGSGDDPFAAPSQEWVSPDGTHVLSLRDGTALVSSVDDPTSATALVLAPDDGGTFTRRVAWSPSGDAVALADEQAVWLWSPWTGERQRFAAPGVIDLVFDTSGRRLAITTAADEVATRVLTFEGLPDPAPGRSRCSGRAIVEGLSADALAEAGVPADVVATAVAVDRAAATCDWPALRELVADEFTASFGGGEAVALWQQGEAEGLSPMAALRAVLGTPPAVSGRLHVWPSMFARDDCDWSADELLAVEALGEDPMQAQRNCEIVGGYIGYRLGIEADGTWRFFVAGD